MRFWENSSWTADARIWICLQVEDQRRRDDWVQICYESLTEKECEHAYIKWARRILNHFIFSIDTVQTQLAGISQEIGDRRIFVLALRISASQRNARNWHVLTVSLRRAISHLMCRSANEGDENNECERVREVYFRYVILFSKEVCILAGGIVYLRRGSLEACRQKVGKR